MPPHASGRMVSASTWEAKLNNGAEIRLLTTHPSSICYHFTVSLRPTRNSVHFKSTEDNDSKAIPHMDPKYRSKIQTTPKNT